MLKKYHLADALVATRLGLAGGLAALAVVPKSWSRERAAEVGLVLFALGELTDAADGGAARRWPYPNDGQPRWWRDNGMNEAIDKCADVNLALATAWLIGKRVNPRAAKAVATGGVALAVTVEALAAAMAEVPELAETRDRMLKARRYLYVGSIGWAIWMLWRAGRWTPAIKRAMAVALTAGGAGLAYVKRGRLLQVKAPEIPLGEEVATMS